jgi:putative ABC transport system permease protein
MSAGFFGLLRRFIVRPLAADRIRSAVTVLGVALGVAVVVAIQLTNASSVRGFATALETVAGKTSLEIAGVGPGFDELLLADLGWLRQHGEVSPVVEGDAVVRAQGGGEESVRILGVDVLRDRSFRDYQLIEFGERRRQPRTEELLSLLVDPSSVILTEKLASRHGVEVGSTVEITAGDRAAPFVVRGLLRDEGPARALDGNFALMDIAAAQLAFDRIGRLDRVDVRIPEGASIDEAERAIASRLPEGLSVGRPDRRGRQVEKMLEAFHFNLAALSYIALLVGLFLIYNTVSISVIARRGEIGTLRAIGASRATVLGLFLAEATALAVVGCAAGLALGRALAEVAVRVTSTTVNALYIASAAAPQPLAWRHAALAFGIGLPLSLVAAALPALEAARVAPTAAMRGGDRLETRFRLRARYLAIPALLLALGWWLATLGPVDGLPLFGYASAVAIVFGAAFVVPAVLYGVGRFGEGLVGRLFRVEGRLAMANVTGAIPRISISVAALAVSLSITVAIAVMIGSFRETVVYWVGQTLSADLYVRPATRSNIATDSTLSPEVIRAAAAMPETEAIDTFRNFDVPYGDGTIIVGSSDFANLLDRRKLFFKEPSDGAEAVRAAAGREAAIVSESFAIKHGARIGDLVRLPTAAGEREVAVTGIYYDYSNDRGAVILDRPVFERLYGAQLPTNLAIYLKPDADPEAAREALLAALGDRYRVFVFTNAALRREVFKIFDATFAITYALEIVAIFVAIMGVASTLLTLVLERRRELAILRLVGADRRQVRKMVVIEAALLGGVSQGIGIVVGMLLSLVLIYVINVQSFGWTIQFRVPFAFLAQSSALILLATALSGLYPAWRACQLNAPEQAMEE